MLGLVRGRVPCSLVFQSAYEAIVEVAHMHALGIYPPCYR